MILQNIATCRGKKKLHRQEISGINAFHRWFKQLIIKLYYFVWILWCLQYFSAFELYKLLWFLSHFQCIVLFILNILVLILYFLKEAMKIIQALSLTKLGFPPEYTWSRLWEQSCLSYNIHCTGKSPKHNCQLSRYTLWLFHLVAIPLPLLG